MIKDAAIAERMVWEEDEGIISIQAHCPKPTGSVAIYLHLAMITLTMCPGEMLNPG